MFPGSIPHEEEGGGGWRRLTHMPGPLKTINFIIRCVRDLSTEDRMAVVFI